MPRITNERQFPLQSLQKKLLAMTAPPSQEVPEAESKLEVLYQYTPSMLQNTTIPSILYLYWHSVPLHTHLPPFHPKPMHVKQALVVKMEFPWYNYINTRDAARKLQHPHTPDKHHCISKTPSIDTT